MINKNIIGCCQTFKDAQESCTDNEGYGRLINDWGNNGTWHIGCDLPSIDFCPWCGSKLEEIKP